MLTRQIPTLIREYQAGVRGRNFAATFSEPWHFSKSATRRVPFEKDPGVYFYTQPAAPDWRLPIEVNEQPVWYIGMTDAGLSRLWDHLRPFTDRSTGGPLIPRFRDNRWAKLEFIPQPIRDSVSGGDAAGG